MPSFCKKPAKDGDIQYWVNIDGLAGTDYPEQPEEVIKDDYCGLQFDEAYLICESCAKSQGLIW